MNLPIDYRITHFPDSKEYLMGGLRKWRRRLGHVKKERNRGGELGGRRQLLERSIIGNGDILLRKKGNIRIMDAK